MVQQQPQTNPQAAMPEPPQMVSTKDAMYFSDMMSWNLLAAKKAHFFASQCRIRSSAGDRARWTNASTPL
ncbi:hypothetical protein LR69_01163 [Geobacillus sp. BCO2]|nr:hypothetical protein LR69_01163 [Geobacillus sp. BCO2]